MDEKVAFICKQTIYDEVSAKEKLAQFNGDEIAVVRDYLNPGVKNQPQKKPIGSLNQAIYKQFREKLTISGGINSSFP